jgi:hypothetical protein
MPTRWFRLSGNHPELPRSGAHGRVVPGGGSTPLGVAPWEPLRLALVPGIRNQCPGARDAETEQA